jgi:hypothetical protein
MAGRAEPAFGTPSLVMTRSTTEWWSVSWSAIVPSGHFSL